MGSLWWRDKPTHEAKMVPGQTRRFQYLRNDTSISVRTDGRNGRFENWRTTLIPVDYFDKCVKNGSIVPIETRGDSDNG